MNKLNKQTRLRILRCLLEGNGIRGTARIVGVSKTTVLKLLTDAGQVCWEYHQETMRGLKCTDVQVDELWSFVGSKKQDAWTWTAVCAHSKAVLTWYTGLRDSESANVFIQKLKGVLASAHTYITSDGLKAYEGAIKRLMPRCSYGMMVKHYVKREDGKNLTIIKRVIQGKPKVKELSTSFVERQNLSIRHHIRRFTRKTNGFSKTQANHTHALSLWFYYYNFVRCHSTLGTTPAHMLGLTKPRGLETVLEMIDEGKEFREAG